jgi:hypothetical protein
MKKLLTLITVILTLAAAPLFYSVLSYDSVVRPHFSIGKKGE